MWIKLYMDEHSLTMHEALLCHNTLWSHTCTLALQIKSHWMSFTQCALFFSSSVYMIMGGMHTSCVWG